jgi:energy-coupling factor transport system substrate-specific component
MATAAARTARGSGRSPTRWRTVELMTAAVIGVTFGVAYWAYDAAYTPLSTAIVALSGPALGLLGGPWLAAGVISALVIRRPGAALLSEVLASTVEAVLGNAWGWTTLLSGCLQGLGVELAFGLFAFRRFGWPVAALGGALAALFEFGYERQAYYASWTLSNQLTYLALFALSGGLVAGVGGWLLTRALVATGAVDALPAGRASAAAAAHSRPTPGDAE